MNGKAQRSFPVKVRDIALDVTVEYEVDDPEYWEYVSAIAEDGANLMDFVYGEPWYSQFDRECSYEMNEWQNTREDAMDAVHAAIETKMMEER